MHFPVQILRSALRVRREKGVKVKTRQSSSWQTELRRRSVQAGFSLTEMLIVVAVSLIVAAMAITQLQPALQDFQAGAAEDTVKSALRQAREYAVTQRRTVAVSFKNDGFGDAEVVLNLYNVANGVQSLNNTPYLTVPINRRVQFTREGTLPDTPDKFGNCAALCFNGAGYAAGTIIEFQSDGTFTDGTGTPINGSIYMGMPNIPATARAITILGSTGRIKSWTGASGTVWAQQ
jgi:prepilin-type N-terminal cleavage/methylation domain-containing protein